MKAEKDLDFSDQSDDDFFNKYKGLEDVVADLPAGQQQRQLNRGNSEQISSNWKFKAKMQGKVNSVYFQLQSNAQHVVKNSESVLENFPSSLEEQQEDKKIKKRMSRKNTSLKRQQTSFVQDLHKKPGIDPFASDDTEKVKVMGYSKNLRAYLKAVKNPTSIFKMRNTDFHK